MTPALDPSSTEAASPCCDVLVIGGGPAGSTMASLLARQGRRVVLVEKCRHPRFHIGESLLPANVPLFEALGLREQIAAIGMPKYGVEFVSPQHAQHSFVEFSQAWDDRLPMAWQVRRSDFDEVLFRHAQAQGAQVVEDCLVRCVAFDAEGATVHAEMGEGQARSWRARYVVDASGRDTLLARQLGIKQRNPRHNSAAMFGHFRGARRLPGDKLQGNISIFWFEHGWFWFIPLADGITSVGAVAWPYYMKGRDKPVREFFLDTIAMCPKLTERLAGAQIVSEVEATGNYSYVCDRSHGPNYLLLGDAYAFVDPVFSSGVMLAMQSAFSGADAVDRCLREPAQAAQALAQFDRVMRHGPREFSWFIFRVTNPTMRGLMMAPRNVLRMKEAVLSVLAGDIYGNMPFRLPLYLFRALYYVVSLANLPRSIRAWRARRRNISVPQEAGASAGP